MQIILKPTAVQPALRSPRKTEASQSFNPAAPRLPLRRDQSICGGIAQLPMATAFSRTMTELPGSQRISDQALIGNFMSYVTHAELAEIVPDLRAMASVEASVEVRAAMIRLADRYAAMAHERQAAGQLAGAAEFAA
jgi:hypothetical protein